MEIKDVLKNFKDLDFIQKFLAFILLVQVSSLLVGIIMRIFAEFGLFSAAIGLYVVYVIVGVVVMFAVLAAMQGKSGSHFIAAITYFLIAAFLMTIIGSAEGGIFTVFEYKSSIFVTWGFTNLFFSIIILIVALLRLIALGAIKDYQRPSKPDYKSTVADLKEELERLKQEAKERREAKE